MKAASSDRVKGIAPASKVRLIAHGSCNGVDTRRFSRSAARRRQAREIRRAAGIAPDAVVILYLGRFTVGKGLGELMDAFVRLADEEPQAHLVCVGGSDQREPLPEHLLRRLREHPRVHLEPWTYDPVGWYAAADVFVLPSYREGFPLTVIEAAAMSLPTVGTDIPGVREGIVSGQTGLLVRPREVQPLLEALRRLIRDPDLRQRLGRRGRARVRRLFESRMVWSGVAKLYRSVLAGAKARS